MWRFFEFLIEGIGWLQIVAAPLIAGCGLGIGVYYWKPDTTGMVLAVFIAASGLIAGIVIATRIWKKTGTIRFLSRISATPELDDKPKAISANQQLPSDKDLYH